MYFLRRAQVVVIGTALAVISTPAVLADDVSGAERLLCASIEATRCDLDGCVTSDPVLWNIPQFIVVDLNEKMLRTTEASGENRTTPAEVLRREDGVIVIQGMELGRAFSIVVSEDLGSMSASIAAEDLTVSVFGACTPLQTRR